MTTLASADVHAWARDQGITVGRGRVPAAVVDAYRAAHPEQPGSGSPVPPSPVSTPRVPRPAGATRKAAPVTGLASVITKRAAGRPAPDDPRAPVPDDRRV